MFDFVFNEVIILVFFVILVRRLGNKCSFFIELNVVYEVCFEVGLILVFFISEYFVV